MTKAEWASLSDRVIMEVRPVQFAVAIKFIKSKQDFDAIPNLKYFQKPGTACKAIGMASHFKMTVGLERKMFASPYCAANCGCAVRDQDWYSGMFLSSPPFSWHHDVADSKKHVKAIAEVLPDEPYIGMACSALCDCNIEEPDVIALQLPPAAAFHLMAGFLEADYQPITFSFSGESGCADTWDYTHKTGKPGLSLGCRGDRATGGLQNGEVRITMKPGDLIKALDGVKVLSDGGIDYPYFACNMLKDDF